MIYVNEIFQKDDTCPYLTLQSARKRCKEETKKHHGRIFYLRYQLEDGTGVESYYQFGTWKETWKVTPTGRITKSFSRK